MATQQASPESDTSPSNTSGQHGVNGTPGAHPSGYQTDAQPAAASDVTARQAPLAATIEAQEKIFIDRQPMWAEPAATAPSLLAGGVVSNWQISAPQPV